MKPEIVQGTRDFSPQVVNKRNYIFNTLRNIFEKYGYQAIETPTMERLSTLTGKYGDEGDQLLFKVLNNGDYLKKANKEALENLDSKKLMPSIAKRGLRYDHMTASRYAARLRDSVRKQDPGRVIDLLIIGAFIEARSCERFAKTAPLLDDELKDFYISLLKSESRHYQDYLKLASGYCKEGLEERIAFFREQEQALIEAPDTEFRFHSGPVSA